MLLFDVGNRGQGVCGHCKALVEIEYRKVGMVFNRGGRKVLVPLLLAGVCMDCEHLVSIPGQSTSAIRAALDRPHGPIPPGPEGDLERRRAIPVYAEDGAYLGEVSSGCVWCDLDFPDK